MAVSPGFSGFVLEQLGDLDGVSARRMFGGVGLFCQGVMFGLIASDRLYFKVGDGNRGDYEDAGCAPFTYTTGKGERGVLSYCEAPDFLMDEADEMAAWARKALDEALKANVKKPKKRKTKPAIG